MLNHSRWEIVHGNTTIVRHGEEASAKIVDKNAHIRVGDDFRRRDLQDTQCHLVDVVGARDQLQARPVTQMPVSEAPEYLKACAQEDARHELIGWAEEELDEELDVVKRLGEEAASIGSEAGALAQNIPVLGKSIGVGLAWSGDHWADRLGCEYG